MKKSAEKKIKASKQQLVDPIQNAIVKKDEEIKPTEVKKFIEQLSKQDSKFNNGVTVLTQSYNECYRNEIQLHKMVDGAKQFNQNEVRISRADVADKLKPVIEKIVDVLGSNVSKRKIIYSIYSLLRFQDDEGGKPIDYGVKNINAIMKIYEEKYGLPAGLKESEKEEKKKTQHASSETKYTIEVDDTDLLDKMFNGYQSTRESGTFDHLLIELDNHYDLIQMTVVTT